MMTRFTTYQAIRIMLLFWSIWTPAQAETLVVGDFDHGHLDGWVEEVFQGKTSYDVIKEDGKNAIRAVSQNSASGLYREVTIDLAKTPYMNWSWKIESVLSNAGEQHKQGDDYAARVYVIFSGGFFFWKTRALNYVWSSHQPIGTHWPNAFSSNAHMIAQENNSSERGKWIHEKRNIREDFKRILGTDILTVDAVAIMTDTDNTHQKATAYYGSIFFTSE